MNKRNIMLIACGDSGWIGGLYYIKNMLFALSHDQDAMKNFNIYIYLEKENFEIFKMFRGYDNIHFIYKKNYKFISLINKVSNKFLCSSFNIELVKYCLKLNIKYLYPVTNRKYLFLKKQSIHWIPDFQHVHLKHLFSERELKEREKIFEIIAKEHSNLILSSNDSYNDYISLFPTYNYGVHVIPFVSAIDDDLLKQNNLLQVLNKYKIPKKYFLVPNQFWMHKNHITVFKAVNKLVNEQNIDIHVICTGNTNDFRNKDYINELLNYIRENKLEDNIHILGFISRYEQIELIKGAVAIIQPSLFEGWGTVVEDAKALQKNIILSDIDVHYEQKNDNCRIFSRLDYNELANIIKIMNENIEEIAKPSYDDEYIETKSKEYGAKLYEVFSN